MAARATEKGVKGIFDTTMTVEQLAPFVTAANTLVNDLLLDEGYGVDLLTQIELYLAAHFAAARDPRVSEETTGSGRWKYEGKTGMGLHATSYGQRAMILDHHGKLAEVSGGKGATELKVLG